MSKVIIDRAVKAVRVEVDKVIDACWLGHKFAMRHQELADQDWNIICYPFGDLPSVWPEWYVLDGEVGLPYATTTAWVDAIAAWIKNPPQPQYCPQCGRPL